MNLPTFTKTGAKSTTAVKFDDKLIPESPNHQIVKDTYEAILSNQRQAAAKTKTRGQVRGGGRKPWRQKGTGRARFGSSRNPIWRGGGVVFGPTGNENFKKSVNKSAKKSALSQVIGLKIASNQLVAIESLPTNGKVADVSKLINKLNPRGDVLIVVDQIDESQRLATRNLSGLTVVNARLVNTRQLMDARMVAITKDAVATLSQRLEAK